MVHGISHLERKEQSKEFEIKGFYGIQQFFVDAEDKGHGPARDAGHDIGRTHTKAFDGNDNI